MGIIERELIIKNIHQEKEEIIVEVVNQVHFQVQVQEEEVQVMKVEDIQEDQVILNHLQEEVNLNLIIQEVKVEVLDLFLLLV